MKLSLEFLQTSLPSNTAKPYWVVDDRGLQVESSLLP